MNKKLLILLAFDIPFLTIGAGCAKQNDDNQTNTNNTSSSTKIVSESKPCIGEIFVATPRQKEIVNSLENNKIIRERLISTLWQRGDEKAPTKMPEDFLYKWDKMGEYEAVAFYSKYSYLINKTNPETGICNDFFNYSTNIYIIHENGDVYYVSPAGYDPGYVMTIDNSGKDELTPTAKSIDNYLANYQKSPTTTLSSAQLKKLVQVFTLGVYKCSSNFDFCSPEDIKNGIYIGRHSLFSDAGWNDGKDHEFYFEYGMEGGALYYGPFKDNVLRLKQEASQLENFLK